MVGGGVAGWLAVWLRVRQHGWAAAWLLWLLWLRGHVAAWGRGCSGCVAVCACATASMASCMAAWLRRRVAAWLLWLRRCVAASLPMRLRCVAARLAATRVGAWLHTDKHS